MAVSFEKILRQWERQQKFQSDEKRNQPGSRKNSPSMDDLLEMYPPDRNMQHWKEEQDRIIIHTEKKRLARMEPQDSLDLHGLTSREAIEELQKFLESSRRRGLKKVLVVHGRGLHSPEGRSVLRPLVKNYLEESPLVRDFGKAKGEIGGGGASWILIRS